MYDADKKFQAFVKGDLHVTGWKSQWLIDLERMMAAEKPAPIAPQIQARQVRRPILKCKKCPGQVSRSSASGLCKHCYSRRHMRAKCIFPDCPNELRKVNKTGRCMKHKFMKEAA